MTLTLTLALVHRLGERYQSMHAVILVADDDLVPNPNPEPNQAVDSGSVSMCAVTWADGCGDAPPPAGFTAQATRSRTLSLSLSPSPSPSLSLSPSLSPRPSPRPSPRRQCRCCPALSYQQRMLGFVITFALG